MTNINLVLSQELLDRVDEARGDVPRVRWVRRAVERALDGYPITGGPTQETFDAVVGERDRLEDELRVFRTAERRVSPSRPIPPRVPFRRDVKPFQRGDK